MNELEKCRKEIDKINSEILKLLARRMKIAREIGNYKKQNNLKVRDKKREQEILESLKQKANKLGLNKNYIEKIFKLIIKQARKEQI